MRRIYQRKKIKEEKREIITEPARRSIYDVLQANLKLAKRVNYIHRIIYIGEHDYIDKEIADEFETNYKQTNSGYCTEALSGLLLYYDHYFCYIAEGSEDVIYKHLRLLFNNENTQFRTMKLVATIHHRFLNEFLSYFGRPPQRVEEIDAQSDLDITMRYVTECCEKLYRFANALITDREEKEEAPTVTHRSRSIVEKDYYSLHLPERKLLAFLINSDHLITIQKYYSYYEYIGTSRDYSAKSWPAPKNFIPYDVFDEPYDPITNLPTQGEAKEEILTIDEDRATEAASIMTQLI